MRLQLLYLITCALFAQDIHHVLTTGQSLSVASSGATPALSTSQSRGNYMLSGTSLASLVETTSEAPASGLGNNAQALGDGRVYLVTKHGVGGTAYSGLAGPCSTTTGACSSGGTSSYRNAITAAINGKAAATTASRNYYLDAVVVTHGESDFGNPINDTAAAYAAKLLQWQTDFTADLNGRSLHTGEVPLIVDQMNSWTGFGSPSWTTPTVGGQGPTYPVGVPIGQWQAARDNPTKVFMCTPKYHIPYHTDGLHLTNVSSRWLGAMQAKCVDKIVRRGLPWRPLVPGSITRSGAVVTLAYHIPGGSALVLDTTNVTMSPAGNYGFEWYEESGSGTTISSVSVAGNVATITLSGTPTGTNQRIRYAYTGVRYNQAGPTSGPRGNLRDNDTLTSIDGDALWDWGVAFDEPVGFSWLAGELPGAPARTAAAMGGLATISGKAVMQ